MFDTSIVIMEDQRDLLETYVDMLSKLKNITITPFSNPIDGLNYSIKNKPDVIVTDNMMPYIDGIHVAGKIREIYSPKIVLVSAITTSMLKNNQLSNFDTYIEKPFNPIELLKLLEGVIEDVNNQKTTILDKVMNGLLGDISCIGKDKLFIENVIKALMYDTDRPPEDSIYTILSSELERSKSTIQRNIGKVVDKTYEPTLFQKIMGLNKKPKNAEFINKLLETINERAKNERWD